MRLLKTTTLQMEEFFSSSTIPNFAKQHLAGSMAEDREVPKYAILSHVWGPEEISFQDITRDRRLARERSGWAKVQASCAQACRDGYAYIWIDTCCIDKTSSTELSEAINSMYKWYKDSEICYVYLSDIEEAYRGSNYHSFDDTDPFRTTESQYSRWFSRGWTLQELLAPSTLQFFNKYWTSIGMKKDHLEAISKITGIDHFALNGGDLRRLSIARRMTWAGNRQTTRSEDTAYCLLGIFNINMPLLYGEGANAFIRLQEEIMKISDDQSIFAWKDPSATSYRDDYPEASQPQGLLASSPSVFQYSETVAQFYSESPGRAVSTSTNKGLQVEFLMCQDLSYPSGLVFLAVLNCQIGTFPGVLPGIRLRRLGHNSEQYARIDVSQLLEISSYNSESGLVYQGFNPGEPQLHLKGRNSSKPILIAIFRR
ncbi:HET-domain-containing protein [Hyaloscypha variabilis F]|uniref:HET-domain-containing protein n=1 Tax=Hyaloscypha variabilis (strain UAMH 11265 / GT02V1 / F) TaxID=1149755 RepID=A0A2J6RP83_HYAVF|nr:HET-domain-containing protein [Hyaloscypha variabilis F]